MTNHELILDRLAQAEADLREAHAVLECWVAQAEDAGLILPRGHERVSDGMGGFTVQPIQPSAPQGDGAGDE